MQLNYSATVIKLCETLETLQHIVSYKLGYSIVIKLGVVPAVSVLGNHGFRNALDNF